MLASLQKVKSVGPVALARDGQKLAVVVDGTLTIQIGDEAAAAQTASICPTTNTTKAEITSITWSPSGNVLGILATCGDATAVYRLEAGNLNLAPARKLADVRGFAKALQFSPDGKHLGMLYVEGASRPSGALAAMKLPSGVIGEDGLEIQRVAMIDVSSGKLEQVTPPKLHVYEFSWSTDSSQLAFIAAPAPGENNWWVARLYTEPAAGGEPRQILDPVTVTGSLHGLQIAVPLWSADGSQIAFIGGLMSDQGATGGDIYVVPATGGVPTNLTPGQPTSAAWLGSWIPGQLAYTAFANGKSQLMVLNTGQQDASPKRLLDFPATIGDGRLEMSLAEAGGNYAFVKSSYEAPPEVWIAEDEGGECPDGCFELKQLTHVNAAQKPTWGKTESVEWTNDGYHVQGWLFYPAHYDPAKKYPMIVMVHGGPSSAVTPRWPGAFSSAPFSAMNYFVLEANPRGSYGEGEAFTAANRKDFGYGDLRDILAGVDAVEKQIPAIDDNRLGLTGWSYGGFMTMFGVTQTQRFHAAVAGAGISNWLSYYGENSIDQWMTPFFGATVYDDPAVYAKSSAINYIKQVKTPTLVVVGDRDGECPAPQSFEFWHALKAEGVDTQLVVYPNEGHGFVDPAHRRDVITRAVSWFDTHLQ